MKSALFILFLLGLMETAQCGMHHPIEDCYQCEFSEDNIGFVASSTCKVFYRCQKLGDGSFRMHLFCCPDGLFWNEQQLACTGNISPGDLRCTIRNAPEVTCPSSRFTNECTMLPSPNAAEYIQYTNGQATVMPCAPGTVYNPDLCVCDHGGDAPTCDSDPMLWFKFNDDYNDCQCPKAIGRRSGNANLKPSVDPPAGEWSPGANCAACFDGEGGSVEISYLENWFAEGHHTSFSITMWFYQYSTGFADTTQGLFSNGDCKRDPSIWLRIDNGEIAASVELESNVTGIFDFNDKSSANRAYVDEQWIHVALSYDGTSLQLYINGLLVDQRTGLYGPVRNTAASSNIGFAYHDCTPFFFNGCIDDVRIFDRSVDSVSIHDVIFQGGRM